MRALPAIRSCVGELVEDGVVWDAFAGSSVVAQALGTAGHRVWATDTQHASSVFAQALLGVQATAASAARLPTLVTSLFEGVHPDESRWQAHLAAEDQLLLHGDYEGLKRLYQAVPQRWSDDLEWHPHTPMASTFAGTYLSVRQAMVLDIARFNLRRMSTAGEADGWSHAAVLTALCHAASTAVHSAGKHFAQYMQPADASAKNYNFVRTRSLRDRRIDIKEYAVEAAHRISRTVPLCSSHAAQQSDALSVPSAELSSRNVRVVYADPPYTAQQYSRFYHLLETLALGENRPLQSFRGATPKGLYPADRYLSPFCSRREAPPAFASLINTARSANCSLVLSYSTTGSTSGNERTMSKEHILTLMRDAYGTKSVSETALPYGYRQFNHNNRRTDTTGTEEILIVGVIK